jgi:hypothetical protein
MGKERVNIIGNRYGRLVVLSYSHNVGYGKYFLCKCDCGKHVTVLKQSLTTGKQVSCGCLKAERIANLNKLPDGYLRLGQIFHQMKNRCYNPSSNRYYRYGGRGIKICDEWLSDINTFRKWAIENGYNDSLTIDRIDVDGDYCPENCRWVSASEQGNNTSRTVAIEFNGKTQTMTQWANELGIPTSTLHNRIRVHGWSIERALTEPVRKRH